METEHLKLVNRTTIDENGKTIELPSICGFEIRTNYKHEENEEIIGVVYLSGSKDEIAINLNYKSFLANVCDFERYKEFVMLLDEAGLKLDEAFKENSK